jgi:hypothetical protein
MKKIILFTFSGASDERLACRTSPAVEKLSLKVRLSLEQLEFLVLAVIISETFLPAASTTATGHQRRSKYNDTAAIHGQSAK